jgi:hypothetical protein
MNFIPQRHPSRERTAVNNVISRWGRREIAPDNLSTE